MSKSLIRVYDIKSLIITNKFDEFLKFSDKIQTRYGHASKPTESDDEEPGILHSIGNFFGAVGRGVSHAANWMWEAIKSPFTK